MKINHEIQNPMELLFSQDFRQKSRIFLRRGTQFLETLQHFRQARWGSQFLRREVRDLDTASVSDRWGTCMEIWEHPVIPGSRRSPSSGKGNESWLVVWNINFIFPYIGNNHPNWLSYFQRGWNHQPESLIATSDIFLSWPLPVCPEKGPPPPGPAPAQGEIYGGNQQLDWMIEDVDFGGDWRVENEWGKHAQKMGCYPLAKSGSKRLPQRSEKAWLSPLFGVVTVVRWTLGWNH